MISKLQWTELHVHLSILLWLIQGRYLSCLGLYLNVYTFHLLNRKKWKIIIQRKIIYTLAFILLGQSAGKDFGIKMCFEVAIPGHHPGIQLGCPAAVLVLSQVFTLSFGPSNHDTCLKTIYSLFRRQSLYWNFIHVASMVLCTSLTCEPELVLFVLHCTLKLGQCNNALRTTRNQLGLFWGLVWAAEQKICNMCLEISCSGKM